MNKSKTFVRDDDGHWYCIPYKDFEQFCMNLESEEHEDFCDRWDKYRLNGGVEGIPIVIVEENK